MLSIEQFQSKTLEPLCKGNFETWKSVHYTEVSPIQRLFYIHNNLSGPMKPVCYREVVIYIELVIRSSTVFLNYVCMGGYGQNSLNGTCGCNL